MNKLVIFNLDSLFSDQDTLFAASSMTGLPLKKAETPCTPSAFYSTDKTMPVSCRATISAFDAPNAHTLPSSYINEFTDQEQEMDLLFRVRTLLHRLANEGYELVLRSSISMACLRHALQVTDLDCIFSEILAEESLSSVIKSIGSLTLRARCNMIISDQATDFDAALACHLPSISTFSVFSRVKKTTELCSATFQAVALSQVLAYIYQITVFSEVWDHIKSKLPRCIGINGVDTSGKSTFTSLFARFIACMGQKVTVIHLDDFHNPRALRSVGENEISAYIKNAFDLDTLLNKVLLPLRKQGFLNTDLMLLDLDSDTYTLHRHYHICPDTIVLFEGVLLYRPPIEEYFDYKIYLDISFDEVIRRARERDVPKYGEAFLDRYFHKYIPIQRWYLQVHSPKSKSQVIIDNEDYCYPRLIAKSKSYL